MATINATVNINSDISSYPVNINNSMTMFKAGTCHGLEETTGLRTKKIVATGTDVTIVEQDELVNNGAHKVYVRNTTSNKEFYVSVTQTEEIGRLYGGDWMLFPTNGDVDITVTSAGTNMVIEYMVFADGIETNKG